MEHDKAYYLGGSKEDRYRADRELFNCIKKAGHPILARLYFYSVRVGGSPHFKQTKVSWAFGGKGYEYSDKPAEETA